MQEVGLYIYMSNLLQGIFGLSVSGVTYTIITRCLHEGEDIVVQHFAAKTIENVASTHGRHCTKFATNDTAQVRILKNIEFMRLVLTCHSNRQKLIRLQINIRPGR